MRTVLGVWREGVDEYPPFEDWRAGRASKVNRTNVASSVVSGRTCGHEETESVLAGPPPDR